MAVGLSGERAEVRLVDLSTDYDPALLTEDLLDRLGDMTQVYQREIRPGAETAKS